MVRLEQRQLIKQAVFALAQGVHSTPHRRAALTDIEVESFHKGGVDLSATGRQDLRDRQLGAAHHAVLHPDHTTMPVLLDHLRLEEPRERQPTGLGPRPFVVATLRVNPPAKVAPDSRAIPLAAIAKPSRHTT
jgi:hypothetical protein